MLPVHCGAGVLRRAASVRVCRCAGAVVTGVRWGSEGGGENGSSSLLPRLTLFTKKNEPCSLCDEAKDVLMKYQSLFTYEECYIDAPGNSQWLERYRYDIPVLHLNGQYLMRHRINEHLLAKALKQQ